MQLKISWVFFILYCETYAWVLIYKNESIKRLYFDKYFDFFFKFRHLNIFICVMCCETVLIIIGSKWNIQSFLFKKMRINMCQLQHMTPCKIIHVNNEGDDICVLFVFLDCASTLNNPVNPVRVSSLLEMTFTDINLSPPSIQIKNKIKLVFKMNS